MELGSMRDFLSALEKEGELVRIKFEVDPKKDIGAIAYKTLGGPAVLCEKVKGSKMPLAMNFLNTPEKIAIATNTTKDKLFHKLLHGMENLIEPRLVTSGPCKENKLVGEAVDLGILPIPTWNDEDGGPYINFHGNITRDVKTGARNVGLYRMQVKGPNKTGIFVSERQNIGINYLVAKKAGKKYLEMAVAIGGDPAIIMAATTPLEYGVDELAFIGGLRGRPLEIVKCETIDLEVPACSDIVLEGRIPIGYYEKEGGYGEFTGYYSGQMTHPVFEVSAITFRNDAVFTGTYQWHYPGEGPVVSRVCSSPAILHAARKSFPGLEVVNMVVTQRIIIGSIKKGFEGEVHTAAHAILATQMGKFAKVIIIVDEDIDVYDYEEVFWALHTRYDPEFDTYITPRVPGHGLDPSERPIGQRGIETGGVGSLTSLILIDATKSLARPFMGKLIQPPKSLEEVEKKLEEHGIVL